MKKKTGNKKNKIDKKTRNIFAIVYVVLLILIVVLCFQLSKMSKAKKKIKRADMVVSVVEKNNINFNIVIDELKKGDSIDYLIKVNNHKDDKVNDKDIVYNMEFIADNKLDLSLYEDNKNNNILQEGNKVENLKINGNKKHEIIYKLSIKANKNIKNSILEVKITN